MPFIDRRDAGAQLARLLETYRGPDTLVLGLPRGGVPVAYEVATRLGAPLDVMVARKVGAPGHPEFGIGAVAPGGVRVLDERAMRSVGAQRSDVDQIVHDELQEMERRLLLYRNAPTPPEVHGRVVILVDDGLATGVTARAALRALRAQGPRRLVLAVPVCAAQTAHEMREEADDVVYVEAHEDFRAVGLWYDDFGQTSDEEVLTLLESLQPRAIPDPCPATVPLPGGRQLEGDFTLPAQARGVVVFAHGSGSGRHSPRNRFVAQRFHEVGFGTLLMDLLTPAEAEIDARTREYRFDVRLLGRRLVAALDWLTAQPFAKDLPVGLFGASTGAAAALLAAAERPDIVGAVVSRGGRPDLAGDALKEVRAAALLVVGGRDEEVLALNLEAYERLAVEKDVAVVPGASHLFEEEGALEQVVSLAGGWLLLHLTPRRGTPVRAPAGGR